MSDNADTSVTDTGLDAAQAAFERILAREDGQPDQPKKQRSAEAAPARAEEAAVDDEAEETPEDPEAEEAEDDADAAEEDDDAEDEEDGDEDAELPQKVTVKIDGKTEEVPLDEVVKGYQRQADYSRKTEQLAREREEFYRAEVEPVRNERQVYATLLTALEQQLTELQNTQEPDWDRLWQENPNEWVRQRELVRDRQSKIEAARFERERVQALEAEEAQRNVAKHLQQQRAKLEELVPEARDKAKWETLRPKIRDFALTMGFTPEEVAQTADARAVAALVKAMKYDELLAKKPTPVPPKAAKAVPEHRTRPPRAVTQLTRDKQRLAKTGRLSDAAKVFEGLI